MKKARFDELLKSVKQAGEIARGERTPSREFHVNAVMIKELRGKISLSQPRFAQLIGVDVGTLRNWEQGRREPTGAARALLCAIRRDPKHVIKALIAEAESAAA
jgi:putative transcriptional regulator